MDFLFLFGLIILFPIVLLIILIPWLMKMGLYVIKYFNPEVVNDPQFQAAMKEDF